MLREAALEQVPLARTEVTAPSPDPLQRFDSALRRLTSLFSRMFADAMNESLKAERDRTAQLLNATNAVSESLDLSLVMPTVAQSIRNALGFSHCCIYLWDESRAVFTSCAIAEGHEDPRVARSLKEPLDPATNAIGGRALIAQEFFALRSVAGHYLGSTSCSELGISRAVVHPIRFGDRLLALALSLDTGAGAELDSKALMLTSGIARSVAPAIDNARRHTETRKLLANSLRLQKAVERFLEMKGLEDLVAIICHEVEVLTGASGTAIRIDGIGAVPSLSYKHGEASSFEDEEIHLGRNTTGGYFEALPLCVRDQELGTLTLLGDETALDQDTQRLAAEFATQAAVAIQHALLHRHYEELAAVHEREKLARDLHDSVSQSMYAVAMHNAAALQLLQNGDPGGALPVINDLRKTSLDALREMRLLLFELRPPMLEEEGLVSALQARLAAVEGRAGLRTEFATDPDLTIPLRIAETLYWIAREALNNVLKHAAASRVRVRLTQQESCVVLEMTDDGSGLEETKVITGDGMGLRGMKERGAAVNAVVEISSRVGRGTTVKVVAPVETRAENPALGEVAS